LAWVPGEYAIATLYSPANVDVREGLTATLNAIAARVPLLFPVHPRIVARAESLGLAERLRGRPACARSNRARRCVSDGRLGRLVDLRRRVRAEAKRACPRRQRDAQAVRGLVHANVVADVDRGCMDPLGTL
jgi:hypothetical protein